MRRCASRAGWRWRICSLQVSTRTALPPHSPPICAWSSRCCGPVRTARRPPAWVVCSTRWPHCWTSGGRGLRGAGCHRTRSAGCRGRGPWTAQVEWDGDDLVIDPAGWIRAAVDSHRRLVPVAWAARAFHAGVARGRRGRCLCRARPRGRRYGRADRWGIANAVLTRDCVAGLTAAGFKVLVHRIVPGQRRRAGTGSGDGLPGRGPDAACSAAQALGRYIVWTSVRGLRTKRRVRLTDVPMSNACT